PLSSHSLLPLRILAIPGTRWRRLIGGRSERRPIVWRLCRGWRRAGVGWRRYRRVDTETLNPFPLGLRGRWPRWSRWGSWRECGTRRSLLGRNTCMSMATRDQPDNFSDDREAEQEDENAQNGEASIRIGIARKEHHPRLG